MIPVVSTVIDTGKVSLVGGIAKPYQASIVMTQVKDFSLFSVQELILDQELA
jgi:hypothetical protein